VNWTPYDQGSTLGKTGREGGAIVVDDEYVGAARIILEENCLRAPYAITCAVYGYLLHTRFLADDETAQYALDEMKAALVAIVASLPGADDPDEAAQSAALADAVDAFMRRFP
jgi:hypothetical protein